MVEGRERALKTTLKIQMVKDVVYMILFRFPFDFGVDFRCLGGVLGGLGRVLWRSWAVLGRLGGPGRIFDRKSWFVGPSLAPLGGPSWAPKSIKIDKKSIPKCMLFLHPFWDRFLNDLGSILAPKMEPKMPTKFNVFWHWFLIHFFDVSGWCLLVF